MRRLYEYWPEESRAVIGHNGGPPLDVSFKAWAWRRASAKAWQSPGREVVLRRLKRAEQLGLSYQAYASALMDRGMRLSGLIVMLTRPADQQALARKLANLVDCTIALCLGDGIAVSQRLRAAAAHIAIVTDEGALGAVTRLVAACGLPPAAVFMVGAEDDRTAAEQAGLGLFVETARYLVTPASARR